MKFLIPVFLLCLAINSAFGLPARDPKDDAEFVSVPKGQQGVQTKDLDSDEDVDPDFKDFKGVIDTGAGYPFFSPLPYNPFNFNTGFFDNFEDVFRRLRERVLNSWWSSVPKPGDADWDPSDGNSTSEVKVIDGHKVVVNDTVYTKKDDSGNAIFRVRILNIRPVDSSEETGTTNPTDTTITDNRDNFNEDKGSPEVIEKQPKDNEISGNIDSTESQTSTAIDTIKLHGTNAQYITNSNLNKDDIEIEENENFDRESKITNTPDIHEEQMKHSMETISTEAIEWNEFNSNLNEKFNKNDKQEMKNEKIVTETESKDINRFEDTKNTNKSKEFLIEKIDENNDNTDEKKDDDSDDENGKSEKEYHEFNIDGPVFYDNERKHHKLHTSSYIIGESENKESTEIDSSEEENEDKNDNKDTNKNKYNSEWDDIVYNDDNNNNDNNIDIYESIPIDLSNDIAVNQMLADQGAPFNPDAEIFSVDEFNNRPSSSSSSLSPGFERFDRMSAHHVQEQEQEEQQQQQQQHLKIKTTKLEHLTPLRDYGPIKK